MAHDSSRLVAQTLLCFLGHTSSTMSTLVWRSPLYSDHRYVSIIYALTHQHAALHGSVSDLASTSLAWSDRTAPLPPPTNYQTEGSGARLSANCCSSLGTKGSGSETTAAPSLASQPTSARREGFGELCIRLLSRQNVISYATFGLRLCDRGKISRCSAVPRQSGHSNSY